MSDVLFYLEEPKFGCSQPVRAGDLVYLKSGNIWGIRHSGACVVVDIVKEGVILSVEGEYDYGELDEIKECIVINNGRREIVPINWLEAI